MLKPSGGFFKKLFNPDRMSQIRKRAAPSAPAKKPAISRPTPPGSANRPAGRGSLFGKAMSKKAY